MRAYAITFDLYEPCGGAFKYALNPSKTNEIIYYSKQERDKFIEKYQYLISEDMYYDDIKCYVGELKEIKDMKPIVDAI